MNSGAQICFGRLLHVRLRPAQHKLSYGVFFLRLPLSKLDGLANTWLSLNRFNLLSFYTADYGPRDGSSLEAWMRKLLLAQGITTADGEIVLQTVPRMLGYVFNPISIWYCFDREGGLRAALAEVNNTFGERHNYLLAHADQRPIQPGDRLTAQKLFHVSPFCEVKGHYRFRFEQTAERAFAQIDYHDSAGEDDKLLITTWSGTPAELTGRTALAAFFGYPLMTFGVIARIHWHALLLWRKRVPWFSKPPRSGSGSASDPASASASVSASVSMPSAVSDPETTRSLL